MFKSVIILLFTTFGVFQVCPDILELDALGSIYTVKNNVLFKEDVSVNQEWSFYEPSYGSLAKVQVQNANLIALFYPEIQSVVLLNRDLSEVSDKIDLNQLGLPFQVKHMACNAQRRMWVMDEVNNSILLFDMLQRHIIQRVSLLGVIRNSDTVQDLQADMNGVYLELQNGEYLIFNAQGTFSNRMRFLPEAKWNNGMAYAINAQKKLSRYDAHSRINDTLCVQDTVECDYAINAGYLYYWRDGRLATSELTPCKE